MFYIQNLRKPLAAAITCLLLSSPVSVSAKIEGFYKEGEEGWFWYQDPAPVEEPENKEPEKKEEPSVVVMEAPKDAPPPAEVEEKGPAPLSAAWFRENLQTYMDRAIDNPTKENVEAYYLLQRVMMDKAETFSKVAGKVVVGDKLLDEVNRFSLDGGTVNRSTRIAREKSEEAVRMVSEKAGLFFFFSDECKLCGEQVRILSQFENVFGTKIQPVSIDGSPIKGGNLKKEPILDQGQAELLGIEKGAPAIYMAAPPDKWVPLAFGVVSQNQLMERVLLAAEDNNIISTDYFNETRAVRPNNSIADTLDELDELPEDPQELIRLLRGLEK